MRENIDAQARALFLEATDLEQALRLGTLKTKEERDKAQDRIEELSDMIEALYENGSIGRANFAKFGDESMR